MDISKIPGGEKLGYIHEFHRDFDTKDWITSDDLVATAKERKDELQSWLFGLDEPWSTTSVDYSVHPNYGVGTIPEDKLWVAEYTSIFYDCLESVAIAYGDTPQNAIKNVDQMVKELIEKYYVRPDADDEGEE